MRLRSTFLVAALLLTGTASVVSTLGVRLAAAQVSAPTARLVPDRPSFEAGRLATFVGQGFEPGETVTFQVTRVHGTPVTGTHHTPSAVVADPSGAFPAIWQVCDTDCVGELLRIEAAGQTSGRIGRAMFMDLPALPRPGSRGDLPSGFVTEAAVVPTFERIWSVGSRVGGQYPFAGLMQGTDGALYGTTASGGTSNLGIVFKMNPSGSDFTVLKNFDHSTPGYEPSAELMQGTDGALYGTAPFGGTSGRGTVFKLNSDGTDFTVLLNFDVFTTGGYPRAGLTQGSDGALYGTAPQGGSSNNGTVFKLNTDGTGFAVLQHLDAYTTGGRPDAGLMHGTDGALYGTAASGGTNGHGTVFKLNPDGTGFTVLQNFDGSTTGALPFAGLLQGVDGALYGTAYQGGTNGRGTVFKLNPDGTAFTVLQNLDYSTFGAYPRAGLMQGNDGALYGTAVQGGSYGRGTVFKLNLDGSGFTVLKHLRVGFGSDSLQGAHLSAGLVQGSDGALYGTAPVGGTSRGGTVFKLNPDGTGLTVLQYLDGSTGTSPAGGLMQGTDGALYGTAASGGASGRGTVFKLNPDGTGFTVLKNLDGPTGASPAAGLMQGTGGALYGTALHGGSSNYGTVFKLNSDGTGFTVLQNFDAHTTGAHPAAGLMQGTDGALYGTAANGGTDGGGTVFKLSPDGTGFTVLQNLGYSTGSYPHAGLVQGTDDALYGTASFGGSSNSGTVFKLNSDGSGFTVLQNLDVPNTGSYPHAGLVLRTDGALYGTAAAGGIYGGGTVFKLNPDGSDFGVLKSFDSGADGGYAAGELVEGTDGNLYGTTRLGGDVGAGTVFRLLFDPPVAGFVSGSGWIKSPAGAYTADPALTGKAKFDFVARYKKGETIPTGQTDFQYKVGNLLFNSTNYVRLAVSGARAQCNGSGTINNVGGYSFTLTVIDGQISGGAGADKFRMKITDKASGRLVYDNQIYAPNSAAPTTVLGGGSIIIHMGGGSNVATAGGSRAEGGGQESLSGSTPIEFGLSQNSPNPFDRGTQIDFSLPERSRVSLVVYDLAGREVRALVDGEWEPGRHSATLTKVSSNGSTLGAGVYFARMNAQSLASGRSFNSLRRMVLLK